MRLGLTLPVLIDVPSDDGRIHKQVQPAQELNARDCLLTRSHCQLEALQAHSDGRGIRSKVPLVTEMANHLKQAHKADVNHKVNNALTAAKESISQEKQDRSERGDKNNTSSENGPSYNIIFVHHSFDV